MSRSGNFVERSIMGALSFLRSSVFSDEYASGSGFLQSMDPRIKAASTALFLITALFAKDITVIALLYILCLALAGLSGIRLGFFLKRTWIFIPLFSFFIAIPAIFSVFTPGEPIAVLGFPGFSLIVTRQGLCGASLFVMRVVTSVSFAVLLSVTTKHFVLLKTLRIFGLPQIFIMILGMCYRYIYLFIETVQNTYIAIRSRSGEYVHYRKGQRIVSSNIASLWYRSYRLNEAVYGAMLSRGYSGEPVVSDDFKTRLEDWIWLSVSILISAALLYLNARTGGMP